MISNKLRKPRLALRITTSLSDCNRQINASPKLKESTISNGLYYQYSSHGGIKNVKK